MQEWAPHEGSKAFKILFLGERNEIVTVGFTRQSKREFKVRPCLRGERTER